MSRPVSAGPPANRVLARLSRAAFQRLRPHLELVDLPHKHVLYEPGDPIRHLYFPLTGVVSCVVHMSDGTAAESVAFGRDGVAGVRALLGTPQLATRVTVQVPGRAYRVPAAVVAAEAHPGSPVFQELAHYTSILIAQLSQLVACNALHAIRQRCCRWLLMAHDNVEGDSFPLTQEFLAQMLGVRRASVSEVAAGLNRDGLLDYRRGTVHILNRPALEATACECYKRVRDEFDRRFGSP